jgi:ABC-type multidrug transport system fused ATPase/permease subunit
LIKFDLHIHSSASKYKENDDIVNGSTIENIDTLLNKLDENQIALFSITDHNRFDDSLYIAIDEKLKGPGNQYKNVKKILSGVEFDVQMEEGMKKCHIITIFDSQNKPENYKKIHDAINKNLLKDKEAFYNKKQFEELLYDIGLNTILIACQRKDIHNHSGKHSSLSDSSTRVEEIISIGYINALEYQKPKVEGILRHNLKQISSTIGLVTGSDCHTWSSYPYHDEILKNIDFCPSKAKILPTFKGLLMAITSPETRINCRENTNPTYIEGINTKNDTINFKNGVNAIIGENGSGKSTLLKFINGDLHELYVKSIVSKNQLININNHSCPVVFKNSVCK